MDFKAYEPIAIIKNGECTEAIMYLHFSTFHKLMTNRTLHTPSWQRQLIETHVEDIFQNMQTNGVDTKSPLIVSVFQNKHYLIEGHHRFEAMKRLFDLTHNDFEISLTLFVCASMEDMYTSYRIVNNKEIIHCPGSLALDMEATKVVDKINAMGAKKRIQTPKQYQLWKECIARAIVEKRIEPLDLLQRILDWNRANLNPNPYHFRKPITTKVIPKKNRIDEIKKRLKDAKQSCWISGMFSPGEALELVMNDVTLPRDRGVLGKEQKNKIWERFFGKSSEGACFVCERSIHPYNCEFAHIDAYANGASTCAENFKITCKKCNRECGVMNLEEFKIKKQYAAQEAVGLDDKVNHFMATSLQLGGDNDFVTSYELLDVFKKSHPTIDISSVHFFKLMASKLNKVSKTKNRKKGYAVRFTQPESRTILDMLRSV